MPAHVLILLAACALNILPMVIQHIGGDILLRLTSIHCYGNQFWQGDVFPRWCFEADTGLGSPIFAIYPPLSNILTSLLYPMHWAGVSVYAVYVTAVAVVTLITAFATFKWLASFAGTNAALAGAVIYLFMPYRSEVMVARSGLPELWVMALAPLMLHELRLMFHSAKHHWWRLSVYSALAILAQPAVAMCVFIAMGIYVVMRGMEAPGAVVRFTVAHACAFLLTLPYTLSTLLAMPFLQKTGLYGHDAVWSSRFVLPLTDFFDGRAMHLGALAIMLLAFAWLAQVTTARKRRIPHLEDRNEIRAWIIIGVASIMLLFPISKPFWDVVNYLTHSGFPMRMQVILGMAVAVLIAVYVRWLLLPGRRPLAVGDLLTAVLFLFCVQMMLVRTVDEADLPTFERMVDARIVHYPEYRTLWTSTSFFGGPYALERFEQPTPPPQVEMLEGTAAVRVRQWNWEGIRIETGAVQDGFTLRIHHRYFPLWHATTDSGEPLPLKAEEGTGFMILTLPRGSWNIMIKPSSRWGDFISWIRG